MCVLRAYNGLYIARIVQIKGKNMKLSIKIEQKQNQYVLTLIECRIKRFTGLWKAGSIKAVYDIKGSPEASLANVIAGISMLVYDRIKHGTLVEVSNDEESWVQTRYIAKHSGEFDNCHCVVDPNDPTRLSLFRYVRNIQIKEKDGVYTWEK